MPRQLRAVIASVALAMAAAACGAVAATPAATPPMPMGTCVTIENTASGYSVARGSCEGPHTHTVSAWLPGVTPDPGKEGWSVNPCPDKADRPEPIADGVVCLRARPSAAPSTRP